LDDLLDFGDPLPELSLEAHFHRLGGAGTCSAIPLSCSDGELKNNTKSERRSLQTCPVDCTSAYLISI
jgi:hypothetical protein